MSSGWFNRLAAIAVFVGLSPIAAPRLLAFPYSARIGQHHVYAEAPIDPRLAKIVAEADAAVARSPLASARAPDQSIYLTSGGWRWTWLALQSRAAFATSRPFIETVVVNRSDQRNDMVANGASIAGRRSLHGSIAHEMTHGLIRAHFGASADWRYAADLREGYCDHVAGGGSLTDEQARALGGDARNIPAFAYWQGRKKVEAALAANRGNVDAMFADWRL